MMDTIQTNGNKNYNRIPVGMPGGFFVYNVFDDEGICYADPNVLELFGCRNIEELRELSGNSFIGMVYPDDRERVENTIKEYNVNIRMPHNYIRYRIKTRQETFRYVEDFGHRLHSIDGRTYCYVFIAALEQAEYNASKHIIIDQSQLSNIDLHTDSLTGLLNMDAFYMKSRELLDHESSVPVTVVIFDILGLSDINRRLGHAEGDECIRNLAEKVRQMMPEGSMFFRGHEAAVIAVCDNCSEQSLMDEIEQVVKSCKSRILFGISSADADSSKDDDAEGLLIQALKKAELDLKIKKMLDEKSAQSQALASLIRALQEVDSDTKAHVQRTQKTGVALGRRIGLDDLQLSMLRLLCLLHDIGKIAIPLEILNKPGKFTDDEWTVMRSHTEKGYQIAMATEELSLLADMILSHHERWDGKGYPAGLKQEEIHILSRIIAIVDAYDAMVNDRVYRKALSPEQAQKEILDNAGTQFDPYLAEEFIRLLKSAPELSFGTVTDGSTVRVYNRSASGKVGSGKTKPVAFSKYTLDINDIIIDADDSFVSMTGYTREEAVGKMTQYDLIPEEERDFYIEQVKRQLSEGSIAYLQHPLKRKDGTVIDIICNGERYFDASVKDFKSTILVFQVS